MQANAFALPLPFNYLRLPPLNPTLRRVQLPPYHPAVGAKSPPLLRGSCSLSLKAQITSFPLLQTYPRAWFLYNPAAVKKSKEEFGAENDEEYGGLPKEFYDDEWQARHQEKAKEWEEYRQKEEEKENRKIDEYREIGMRLKGYPEEEVHKARKLVSSFIRSAEEVEEKIEEAAEKGELNELVLMVIWNRLDLARRDEEKDVIRSLDLLYRRIETEILKRESTPAMRLLNDLLNLHDGFDDEGWLKKCRKRMIDTFPREDPLSMLVPAGFDIEKHQGRIGLPPMDDDDVLLRVDFVREVDALLQEVRAEQGNIQSPQGLDPESVAIQLKQQEKQQTIHQVEALLELAVSLKW